jgi:SAM-dependent methyltransferase
MLACLARRYKSMDNQYTPVCSWRIARSGRSAVDLAIHSEPLRSADNSGMVGASFDPLIRVCYNPAGLRVRNVRIWLGPGIMCHKEIARIDSSGLSALSPNGGSGRTPGMTLEKGPSPSATTYEPVSCDLCGADDPVLLLRGPDRQLGGQEQFTLVRCPHCGLIYQNPQPADLNSYYPQGYAPFDQGHQKTTSRISAYLQARDERALRRLVGRAGRVLEIGCATGEYLLGLRQRGWEVTGLEFSDHAAAIARQRGLDVHTGVLLDAHLPAEAFDLVLLRHVLEHVSTPSATLGEIHRLLVPDGKVSVLVPNYDSLERILCGPYWHGYDLPRHLFTFAPRPLTAMMERAGLHVQRIRHTYVPTSYVWSARYWAQAHGQATLARSFRNDSLLAIGLFAPLGLLGAWLHRAGRMQIGATKV